MIYINRYVEVLKEVESLINEYASYDFNHTIEYIKSTTKQHKYSRGGLNRRYGLYEFSIVDKHRICNAPFGREIKKIDKGYNYKYYYSDNQLLFIEKKHENHLIKNSIFIYLSYGFIILNYDNAGRLIELDKYECDDSNRITRRILVDNNLWSVGYEEEIYEFTEKNSAIICCNRYNDARVVHGRILYEMFFFEYQDDSLKLDDNKNKLIVIEDREYIKKKGLEKFDQLKWDSSYQVTIKKINDSIGD